jgi:hypothetical protein
MLAENLKNEKGRKKINAFCSTPLTEEAMFMKMRSN